VRAFNWTRRVLSALSSERGGADEDGAEDEEEAVAEDALIAEEDGGCSEEDAVVVDDDGGDCEVAAALVPPEVAGREEATSADDEDACTDEVPVPEVPAAEVPVPEVPAAEVPAEELPAWDVAWLLPLAADDEVTTDPDDAPPVLEGWQYPSAQVPRRQSWLELHGVTHSPLRSSSDEEHTARGHPVDAARHTSRAPNVALRRCKRSCVVMEA
jgi:hypothetical protein